MKRIAERQSSSSSQATAPDILRAIELFVVAFLTEWLTLIALVSIRVLCCFVFSSILATPPPLTTPSNTESILGRNTDAEAASTSVEGGRNQPPNLGEQLIGTEWLRHEEGGPGSLRFNFARIVVICSHYDDWDRPGLLLLFEAPKSSQAVHLLHHHGHDDQLRLFAIGHFDGFAPVMGFEHLITSPFEMMVQEPVHDRLVVNYQDLSHDSAGSIGTRLTISGASS